MPVGVTWGEYLRFFAAGMISALAGAQTVHSYFKPLEDFDIMVQEELKKRRKIEDT